MWSHICGACHGCAYLSLSPRLKPRATTTGILHCHCIDLSTSSRSQPTAATSIRFSVYVFKSRLSGTTVRSRSRKASTMVVAPSGLGPTVIRKVNGSGIRAPTFLSSMLNRTRPRSNHPACLANCASILTTRISSRITTETGSSTPEIVATDM